MNVPISLLCLALFLACGTRSLAATRGEELPAYYDVRTGNVTIDLTNITDGEAIAYSFSYGRIHGDLRYENFTPFRDTFFTFADRKTVGESDFGGFPGAVYSLGEIFPPGLSESELSTLYFGHDRWGRGGGPSDGPKYYALGPLGSNVVHVFAPIYAPSPFPAINEGGSETEPKTWTNDVTLTYNELTGEVNLAAIGGAIWSYEVRLVEDAFIVDEFLPTSDISRVEASKIVEVGVDGISEGRHSLGRILPSGLSSVELSDLVLRSEFVGEPGHGVESLDVSISGAPMALAHIVPEPNKGHYIIIAVLSMMGFCRNHMVN